MARFKSFLGYAAAVATLLVMLLSPFVFLPRFKRLVAGLGIRPLPVYAGGPVVRTLERSGYRIEVSAPAGPVGPLERTRRFVQVAWSPAAALPAQVDERLDLDGDGREEVRLTFDVPADPKAALAGRVEVLDPAKVPALTALGRSHDLSQLLVRTDQRIIARIPLR